MPKTSLLGRNLADLLDEPHQPITQNCTPELAAIVSKMLNWEPVTIASLVAEGMSENEARSQFAKASALVLKNHGGSLAIAARLMALTGESNAVAAVAASRAFQEVLFDAKRDSDRLDKVRERFEDLARGKS